MSAARRAVIIAALVVAVFLVSGGLAMNHSTANGTRMGEQIARCIHAGGTDC